MDAWPYQEAAGFDIPTVNKHCVRNEAWQKVRLSMKGKPTAVKLDILESYRNMRVDATDDHSVPFDCQVQIVNYLGALRRGGQLDMNNRVAKYI